MADYLQVPGAQVTEAERRFIKDVAAGYNRPESVLFNVGIMWGCTLWCLREGAPHAKLYGLDISPDKWKITELDKLNAAIILGDSRNYPFDLLIDVMLIDGDHHYSTVSADIANWYPRVASGGTLIFHDYSPTIGNLAQFPELEGVKRAVDEWHAQHPEWDKLHAPDSLAAFKRR